MKKIILTSLALCFTLAVSAQKSTVKKDTVKASSYNYFVVVPVSDYQQLLQLAQAYRSGLIYNPNMKDADKVNEQKGIDAYLPGLGSRIKVDSVRVKKP